MDDIEKIKRERKAQLRKKQEDRLKRRKEEAFKNRNNKVDDEARPPAKGNDETVYVPKSHTSKSKSEPSKSSTADAVSVASSLSFSQSPERKSKLRRPKPSSPVESDKVSVRNSSSKHQIKSSLTQLKLKENDTNEHKESKHKAPVLYDGDDSESSDGLMSGALLLAKRRQEEARVEITRNYDMASNGANMSHRHDYSDGDDNSSSSDGLLQSAQILAERKARQNNTEPPLTSLTIPIEDATGPRLENNESQPSLMSTGQSDATNNEMKNLLEQRVEPSAQIVASLWSDSENEETKVVEKKRKRTKPTLDKNALNNEADKKSEGITEGNGKVEKRAKPSKDMVVDIEPHFIKKFGISNQSSVYEDILELEKENEVHPEELKPYFEIPRLGRPAALVPLILKHQGGERFVPASINRYLKGYQREGIVFLHNRVTENEGAILGDDMGLGKTVQIISLLSALLKKKGSGEDLIDLRHRQKMIQDKRNRDRKEYDRAMQQGTYAPVESRIEGLKIPKWVPILIVVPPSVIENWMNEFAAWGHFGVVKYQGASRDRALERIKLGLDEVMVCGRSLFQSGSDDMRQVMEIKWKLIVVDEYHQYKNFKTIAYKGLKLLKETSGAPLLGLTGTLMQNKHEELWAEIDLVNPGSLGSWEEFREDTSFPIRYGRTKTAGDEAIEESNVVRDWLNSRLKSFFISRRKADVLKDELPLKDERVLFCELSPIQKRLYQHMMTLPDFVLLKYANAPCECGVNQAIFQGFKRMRTDAEKVAYQRAVRDQIIPRKECCHKKPLNPRRFEAGEEFYDPCAVLWCWQHPEIHGGTSDAGKECLRCPYCISFAALDKLYKLSSHVALLQVARHPDEFIRGSRPWKDARKALDFVKVAFPIDLVESLPGGYLREDGIMNDHANLSGKMKILAELLVEFDKRDDRLLVFSFSTQMLDLIQNFVRAQGYTFLRLDGSTPTKSRQGLVDKFQSDKSIFLFLISTKAGGLGLNLTAANVVIVFDVDFNPTNDEQSQDRAYRIGQKRDVLVIRLVSRGTVEELKYIRQIYKVQLTNDTIGTGQGGRLFNGVAGDSTRKGELFGMENLLKYKDGSFMDDLWKSSNTSHKSFHGQERFGLRSNAEIATGVEGMTEEDVHEIGGNVAEIRFQEAMSQNVPERVAFSALLAGGNAKSHDDFLWADRGDAMHKPGEEGFEEEMGGCSQAVHFVMENADVLDEHQVDVAPSPAVSEYKPLLMAPSPVLSTRTKTIPQDQSSFRAERGHMVSSKRPISAKEFSTLTRQSPRTRPQMAVTGEPLSIQIEVKGPMPALATSRSKLSAKDLLWGKKSKKKRKKPHVFASFIIENEKKSNSMWKWKFWKKSETGEEKVLRYEREWEAHVAKSRKSKEGGNDYRALLEMGFAVEKAMKHQELTYQIQRAKDAAILENKIKLKKYHAKKKVLRKGAKTEGVIAPTNEVMKRTTARAEREAAEAAMKAAMKEKMHICEKKTNGIIDGNEGPLKEGEEVDDNDGHSFELIWSEVDDYNSDSVGKMLNKTKAAIDDINESAKHGDQTLLVRDE